MILQSGYIQADPVALADRHGQGQRGCALCAPTAAHAHASVEAGAVRLYVRNVTRGLHQGHVPRWCGERR